MGGEVLVRGVEHDLALPRVGGDAGLEVVGRDARGGASEELERVDVAAQPGVLLHVEGRLDVAVPAEGQAGDEQVDLRDDAGRRVDEGHGRTGPVDLHVPARLAADPAHDVPADRELPVPLAEAVVGRGRLAPRGALLAVLAVQEPERDADLRELGVDRVPIRVRVHRPRLLALREQAGVHFPGARPFRFLPGDVVLGRGPEHDGDAGFRRVQRGGDRVER